MFAVGSSASGLRLAEQASFAQFDCDSAGGLMFQTAVDTRLQQGRPALTQHPDCFCGRTKAVVFSGDSLRSTSQTGQKSDRMQFFADDGVQICFQAFAGNRLFARLIPGSGELCRSRPFA